MGKKVGKSGSPEVGKKKDGKTVSWKVRKSGRMLRYKARYFRTFGLPDFRSPSQKMLPRRTAPKIVVDDVDSLP